MTYTHHNDVILLVTSTMHDWSTVIEVLLEHGYNVESAQGGVVALSMLDNQKADLLIIDNTLNDLAASEVIRIVRYVYPKSRLPIFLVLDTEALERAESVDKSEINGVLKRPIDTENLLARVKGVLKSRRNDSALIAHQQESASTQLEKLMLINKALKRQIRQRKRIEQRLRREIKRRQATDSSVSTDSASLAESENESTGLISRTIFESRLEQLINVAENGVSEHVLCFLQATNLEQFEECYGAMARDGLLRQLARVLQSCIRKDDSLTDLGNGEFLLLMQHCSADQAEQLMNKFCDATRSYRFVWHDEERKVDLRTGVVPITRAESSELISAAKTAAEQANICKITNKIEKNNVLPSNAVVDTGSAEYLLEAMHNGRFQLYYQPIESLQRNPNPDSVRFELFLRLQDEFGRFIRPAAFLPAIERFELVSQLDRWTISTAFTWLASHMTISFKQLALCCINLSGQSLSDETLREYIQNKFSETGVPPDKICFEINETAAIANINTAGELMSELGKSGCTFALDDFGSGMSSLAYMNNLPAEYIKIDGRFVKNIAGSTSDLSTVKSINEIAHVLGKKTIAEFVEDGDILNKLKEIGVDYAQGYAIGRPLPIKALLVKSLAAPARM